MAVNLCPGSPSITLCSSPRLSFSHDLDHHPPSSHIARSDHTLLHSPDFEFHLPPLQSSTADDLFSGGILLPADIKHPNPHLPEHEDDDATIVTSTTAKLIREDKPNNNNNNSNSKSFWRFMRSSSLNSDSKRASIWSSLPLLARSNSTGSSSNTKQSSHGGSSTYRKSVKPVSVSSSSSNLNSGFSQKPPLGKSYGAVPPPYIAKGASDLLGLGSLFRHGNDRKGKKR